MSVPPAPETNTPAACAVVPGTVVAADRVVMRDRAAALADGIRGGGLDRLPLLQLLAPPGRPHHRVVRRRAVGVDVRESERDPAPAGAGVGHGGAGGGQDLLVEALETVPGDGGLESL